MSSSDTLVLTPEARLSFPAVFEPKPVMKGETKVSYQAAFLFPPDTDFKPFAAAIKAAMIEKWGKVVKDRVTLPIKNAEDKSHLSGYEEGWHYISTSSKYAPAVVNRRKQPVTDHEKVYAGMWVRGYLNAWAWEHPAKGRGVSFGLTAMQLVRDDEPFGFGGVDTDAAFDDLGDLEGAFDSMPEESEEMDDDLLSRLF